MSASNVLPRTLFQRLEILHQKGYIQEIVQSDDQFRSNPDIHMSTEITACHHSRMAAARSDSIGPIPALNLSRKEYIATLGESVILPQMVRFLRWTTLVLQSVLQKVIKFLVVYEPMCPGGQRNHSAFAVNQHRQQQHGQ